MSSSAAAKVTTVAEGQVAEIQALKELAAAVFEDRGIAERWLQEPNLATDNKPPLEILTSEAGFARLKILLQRIEYGVLA